MFSRNWGFISPQTQEKIWNTKILLAGTGLGSVIALLAARTGFGKFILADGDNVELSNLNRQAFFQSHIGQNKAESTAELLAQINPNIEVEIIPHFLTQDSIDTPISKADIVVNTIDFNHAAFLYCNRQAKYQGKPVLFPLNLGWGGALLVFTSESATLEETIGLIEGESNSLLDITVKLVYKIFGEKPPGYLEHLQYAFQNPTKENWPSDPQLGVATMISSSLAVQSAVALTEGRKLKCAPLFTHLDTYESM